MTEKSRAFISYTQSDGEKFIKKLFRKIEKAGILCWLDWVKMKGKQK